MVRIRVKDFFGNTSDEKRYAISEISGGMLPSHPLPTPPSELFRGLRLWFNRNVLVNSEAGLAVGSDLLERRPDPRSSTVSYDWGAIPALAVILSPTCSADMLSSSFSSCRRANGSLFQ